MKDESKTKRQLIQELAAVRQIVQEFAGSGGDATLLPETVYARVLKVSDEWFRTLVEHAPFGLSIMNEGKSFEYVNPQFIEMFGYTLEDIPDKDMWFLRAYPDEEYREMVKGIWDEDTRRASDAKDVFTRTFRVTTKRGDAKAIRFKKVQLPEGKQFYWYDDITAKLEAEEALRQSEARYRTVFENTGTATVMVEKDSIISMVNTEFENLSGYRKEEIAGKVSWEVFVDDEDRGRMAEYHRKRREGSGGVPREYEFRFVTREGEV
ncbi:MAG: PAS domain S-box protein, partial [Deltaproteobacteria bacterium]|nr:PAS domain S-box protein [Deltaproteobacteria bacterium]